MLSGPFGSGLFPKGLDGPGWKQNDTGSVTSQFPPMHTLGWGPGGGHRGKVSSEYSATVGSIVLAVKGHSQRNVKSKRMTSCEKGFHFHPLTNTWSVIYQSHKAPKGKLLYQTAVRAATADRVAICPYPPIQLIVLRGAHTHTLISQVSANQVATLCQKLDYNECSASAHTFIISLGRQTASI